MVERKKTFRFTKQVERYNKRNMPIMVTWSGLTPQIIIIQKYNWEEEEYLKKIEVDNDKHVKVKHWNNREQFVQAA